ncbi:MAG: hypothetical protein ABSH20_04655 [Tepidisphaeraceae bacterium]
MSFGFRLINCSRLVLVLWTSFEEGINRRLIVINGTFEQVLSTLLDRSGE